MFPDLADAANRIIKVKEVIQPDPEWVKIYDKLYPLYVSMYEHLDRDLVQLNAV